MSECLWAFSDLIQFN